MDDSVIHLELDAPTSLHGNGASSFALTTRDPAQVSCDLCLYLWQRNPFLRDEPDWESHDARSGDRGAR